MTAATAAEQFERIWRAEHSRVVGLLYRRTGGDRSLAEDLAAEAFTELWEALASGMQVVENAGAFCSWLARSAWIQHMRLSRTRCERPSGTPGDRGRDEDLGWTAPVPSVGSFENDAVSRVDLGRALAMLSAREREAVVRRYCADQPADQAAAGFGLSQRQTYQLATAGVQKLQAVAGVQGPSRSQVAASRRAELFRLVAEATAAGRPVGVAALGRRIGMTESWVRLTLTEAGVSLPQPVSIVAQLREAIGAQVTSGAWPPGSKVPGGERLAEQFDTSTGQVSHALRSLVAASVLDRRADGYYVAGRVLAEAA